MRSTNGVVGGACGLFLVANLVMGCSADVEGAGQGGGAGDVGTGGAVGASGSSMAGSAGSSATGAGGSGGGSSGAAGGSGSSSDAGGVDDASRPMSDGGCQFSDVVPPALFAMLFPDIQPPYTY